MSLLGRLEDLSLTDIVQIVFLSRRTGVLEVIDASGRYTVLFRHGLLANASSPEAPDLGSYLLQHGEIPERMLPVLRSAEESGVPVGSAVIEMNLMTPDALAAAIQRRIADVIAPLVNSRDGEFNFILSDSIGPLDTEYDTESIFREGGIPPSRILGGDGEKIKPLKDLEQTMKAGKALLRSAADPGAPSAQQLEVPVSPPPATPEEDEAIDSALRLDGTLVQFPQREDDEDPFELGGYDEISGGESLDGLLADSEPPDEPAAALEPIPKGLERPATPAAASPEPSSFREEPAAGPEGQFRVSGDEESDERNERNIILFERDPMVRVAARRAFAKRGFRIFQFTSMDDVRETVGDLLRLNHFFVTFLELETGPAGVDDDARRLLQIVKKKNRHLPVVMIDHDADLRRRHRLLQAGADLYLTKPPASHLQPGLVEEQLALFADELVLFGEKAFSDWEQITGTFAEGSDVGRQFYDIARKEKTNRSFSLLKQLINELSNPNDIGEIAQTILHLAAEYLERGVLFMVQPTELVGIAGFGSTGAPDDLSRRSRRMHIPLSAPSVLGDVARSASTHRGKLRKSSANVQLIAALGTIQPTEVAVMPIIHQGTTVGVLYGDNAESRSSIDDTAGLEIFLSQAGMAFGNALTARSRNRTEKLLE